MYIKIKSARPEFKFREEVFPNNKAKNVINEKDNLLGYAKLKMKNFWRVPRKFFHKFNQSFFNITLVVLFFHFPYY